MIKDIFNFLSSLSTFTIFLLIFFVIFFGFILWLNMHSKEYRQFLDDQKKQRDN